MGPCGVQGSAWKALPSSRPPDQAGPTCPPEGSVLLTLSSGGAGLRGLRSENRGGPPPRQGRRGAGREEHLPQTRNRPSLSQLSVQSIQELVGEFIHKEPGPGHTRPFPAPAPRRLSILRLCIGPPGCVSPPTACSVSGRVTGQMFMSHHLELWTWGFLITDFVSSFAHHRWYQGCPQPFHQGPVTFQLSSAFTVVGFLFHSRKEKRTSFLSGLSRVRTRAVASDGPFRSGSVTR